MNVLPHKNPCILCGSLPAEDRLVSDLSDLPDRHALHELLHIRPGLTAVIGSGGKTTLLRVLAGELSERGTVILTTTTHFLPFAEYPLLDLSRPEASENAEASEDSADTALSPEKTALRAAAMVKITQALQSFPVLTAASVQPSGKLAAPQLLQVSDLCTLADYVLVEADGSRRLPLKAHAPWEPQIPEESMRTILVAGASGLYHPIREVVHRPELFVQLLQDGKGQNREGQDKEGQDTSLSDPHTTAGESTRAVSPDSIVTPFCLAETVLSEHLGDLLLLNQIDTLKDPQGVVDTLQSRLDIPVLGVSLAGFL